MDCVDRIEALLQELTPVLGPPVDGDGDVDELYDVPNTMRLIEWVVAVQFTDLNTGYTYSTMVKAPNMLPSHARGLLHEVLANE